MPGYSFARAWHDVATIAPERVAIACRDVHLTFGELDERADRLARFLQDAGVGATDKVAIECVNSPEYLETFFAALKLGAVPVNVNYRYVGTELAYLLENSDAAALVFHDEFAPTVHEALDALSSDRRPRVLIEVPHAGNDGAPVATVQYEAAIAAGADGAPVTRPPSGDDLIFLYTGGTTGYPKAVMWRSDDLYVSLWQMARPSTTPPDAE